MFIRYKSILTNIGDIHKVEVVGVKLSIENTNGEIFEYDAMEDDVIDAFHSAILDNEPVVNITDYSKEW